MSNYTIPVLPPGRSITSNNTPGRGYSSTIISTGSTNPITPALSYSIGSSLGPRHTVIMGGKHVDLKGDNTTVISATARPFEADEDASGTLFLRSDKGVMIETTTPGEFINASEELEKIDDILDELREIKDMLHDMYWAPPNGPGYLKSKMNFDNLKDEDPPVPKTTENQPNTSSTTISSSSPSTIISSSSPSTIISSSSRYNTHQEEIDNTSYSARGCTIQ